MLTSAMNPGVRLAKRADMGNEEPVVGKQERLPRVVGVGSATALVIGTMIGSGIFSVPAVVAAALPAPETAILCWIVGGLITLCGAMSVAELAAALPQSGGPFAYLLEAYGPLTAFLLGWTALTVVIGAVLGAVAMIFANYLAVFLPLTSAEVHDAAALLIVLLGAMNYMGVRRAAAVMSLTTAAKLIALVALGVLAFTATRGHAPYPSEHTIPQRSLSAFALALMPVMWTYDGWEDLTYISAEVIRPQRTLPLALGLGIVCVIAVYLLVNLGFYHALPPGMIAHSPLVASTVAARIPMVGSWGAAAIAGIVLLSSFSALNGAMMSGPRVLYAMAERGLLFAAVGRVSPRYRTPSVAIWLATALGCADVLAHDFALLANRFVLGAWPFFMLTVAAVFVLRRTRPDLHRPYRTWGYPLIPAVFLLASLAVLGYSLATYPRETMLDFVIILSGIPVYYLWRGLAARATAPVNDRF
jgi:APA family basic amino acid/polyamine antiporter